jgi:hypothetical protein
MLHAFPASAPRSLSDSGTAQEPSGTIPAPVKPRTKPRAPTAAASGSPAAGPPRARVNPCGRSGGQNSVNSKKSDSPRRSPGETLGTFRHPYPFQSSRLRSSIGGLPTPVPGRPAFHFDEPHPGGRGWVCFGIASAAAVHWLASSSHVFAATRPAPALRWGAGSASAAWRQRRAYSISRAWRRRPRAMR